MSHFLHRILGLVLIQGQSGESQIQKKKRKTPLPILPSGRNPHQKLQEVIDSLEDYVQPERHPVRLKEYIPWEKLKNLKIEKSTDNIKPALHKSKQEDKDAQDGPSLILSCNTIAALFGDDLPKDEEEEEEDICFNPTGATVFEIMENHAQVSDDRHMTRSGRRWGHTGPQEKVILLRGEKMYKLPEAEVRGTEAVTNIQKRSEVPPPPGLYPKDSDKDSNVAPSFVEFLTADQNKGKAVLSHSSNRKAQAVPVTSILNTQSNHAKAVTDVSLPTSKADQKIIKLL